MIAKTCGLILRTIHDSILIQYCLLRNRAREVRRQYAIARAPKRNALQSSARTDVTQIDLQTGAHFQVYWKRIDGIGEGPCASLYVRKQEVLRFDCFGKGSGHFHTNLRQPPNVTARHRDRLFFMEESIEEQIARCEFEIRVNGAYHLQRNLDSRIARFEFAKGRLAQVSEEVKQKMLELYRSRSNSQIESSAA